MDQIYAFFENMDWAQVAFALAILIIGIIVAYVLRGLVAGVINRTGLGKRAQTTGGNIGNAIGKAVFWLVILYVLYLALSRLNMGSYLGPVDDLFSTIGVFIPKLIGAGFTFFIGYIVAKVAKNATTATLEAAQVDNLAARTGVTSATGSEGSLAKALGTLIFVLIIVPVAIAALSILDIPEISVPLSDMLSGFVNYIPELVAAAIVLALSVFIGRFVSNFLQNFLPSLGFDSSINEVMMLDDGEGLKTSPSKAAGYLAFLIILVIGVSAAVSILGNDSLSRAFDSVQTFGGQLLEAAVLIVIGVFLASLVGRFMSSVINPKIATFVKYAFMVLFIFLGLAQLDPAGTIIPVAFSAFVISAAVAAAIAFGVGGRDWAAKVLEKAIPSSSVKKLGDSKPVKKAPVKKPATRRAAPPKK
ncbi:mechanosensitive ion channel [Litorimonas sp. WD9-15]|uniref:mechanosensitive ion channel n=1 Tax=Litorimonas sp. WD9-15 TaxID=3418716 RepID=UPI003D0920D7